MIDHGHTVSPWRCLPFVVAAPAVWFAAMALWMALTNWLMPLLPQIVATIFGPATVLGYVAIFALPYWLVPHRYDPGCTVRPLLVVGCPLLVMPIWLSFY